jgi:hypothetical protein
MLRTVELLPSTSFLGDARRRDEVMIAQFDETEYEMESNQTICIHLTLALSWHFSRVFANKAFGEVSLPCSASIQRIARP